MYARATHHLCHLQNLGMSYAWTPSIDLPKVKGALPLDMLVGGWAIQFSYYFPPRFLLGSRCVLGVVCVWLHEPSSPSSSRPC